MDGKITLPSLPEDVIMVILSMVPAKSIIRFRCVCKLWLELFKNPGFIKTHLNHASQNHNFSVLLTASYERTSYYRLDFDAASASYSSSDKAVKIDLPVSSVHPEFATTRIFIGSCNGIICFSRHLKHSWINELVAVCLWNPTTREYKEVAVKQPYNGYAEAHGFGYDYKIDDYKFISIFNHPSNTFSEIHVYIISSNSWKIIRNTRLHCYTYYGKLLNGATHWVARKDNLQEATKTQVIASFDIAEERTKEIQIPSCLLGERYNRSGVSSVDVLGKDLGLSVFVSGVLELWVMKGYGVVDSWTKLLSISEEMEIFYNWNTLISINKNREILFKCVQRRSVSGCALVSYDLRNGRLTCLNTYDGPEIWFTAEAFIGSLVSP